MAVAYSLLALILSSLLLPFSYYVTSDGVDYLRVAENLFSGKGIAVNAGEPYVRHPPFYSFLIGLANLFWKDLEFSGHFVSILSFSLAAIPLFYLARQIYSRSTAHWVSFLYATHGFLLVYSNLIMTEPLFILLVLTQLYLLHRIIQADSLAVRSAILIGIVGGLGYLTRPEGFIFYLVGLISLFVLGSSPLRKKFFFSLLSTSVFLIFLLPYVFFLHRATGRLELSGLFREMVILRQLDFANPGRYLEVKKIQYGLSEDKKGYKIDDLVEDFSLTDYVAADQFALIRGGLYSMVARALGFNNYFFGGAGFLFVGASFLSVPWDRRRQKSELLLLSFLPLFLPYTFLIFYPRRFLFFLPIFLLWMGNGLNVFVHWLKESFGLAGKRMTLSISGVCLLLVLPSVGYLRGTIPKGDFPWEDKSLGLWMKENIPTIQEEKVASGPFYFLHFYSKAKIFGLPYVDRFEDFLNFMFHQNAKFFVVTDDLVEPLNQSYDFLLDETQPPPPGILRRHTVQGKRKKMILYEIQ